MHWPFWISGIWDVWFLASRIGDRQGQRDQDLNILLYRATKMVQDGRMKGPCCAPLKIIWNAFVTNILRSLEHEKLTRNTVNPQGYTVISTMLESFLSNFT